VREQEWKSKKWRLSVQIWTKSTYLYVSRCKDQVATQKKKQNALNYVFPCSLRVATRFWQVATHPPQNAVVRTMRIATWISQVKTCFWQHTPNLHVFLFVTLFLIFPWPIIIFKPTINNTNTKLRSRTSKTNTKSYNFLRTTLNYSWKHFIWFSSKLKTKIELKTQQNTLK
jgi:hypothetical protein